MHLNSRSTSSIGMGRSPTAQVAAFALVATALPLLSVSPTHAQSAITYVSGQGSDGNACTQTAPCLTLQGALAQTTAGGQIYVLDSANYGALTINKAVTITSEGAVAGVLATTGVGISINAGANDVINLRGLDLDGRNSGVMGIQFNSGRSLNIQKSAARGFTNSGISFEPTATSTLFVTDTAVTDNRLGISVLTWSGAASAVLNRVTASANGVGIFSSGPNVNMTVIDTLASNNNYGVGATSSVVMMRNSTVSNNATGIASDEAAIVRIGQSTVTANGTGWQATNSGQVQSYGNNNVSGNAVDGVLTTTIALQ